MAKKRPNNMIKSEPTNSKVISSVKENSETKTKKLKIPGLYNIDKLIALDSNVYVSREDLPKIPIKLKRLSNSSPLVKTSKPASIGPLSSNANPSSKPSLSLPSSSPMPKTVLNIALHKSSLTPIVKSSKKTLPNKPITSVKNETSSKISDFFKTPNEPVKPLQTPIEKKSSAIDKETTKGPVGFKDTLMSQLQQSEENLNKAINNALKAKQNEIDQLKQQIKKLEASNEQLVKDMDKKRHENDTNFFKLEDLLDKEKQRSEGAIKNLDSLKALVVPLKNKLTEQQTEINKIKKEKDSLEKEKSKHLDNKMTLESTNESLRNEIREIHESYVNDKSDLEKKVKDLTQDVIDSKEVIKTKETEIASLKEKVKNVNTKSNDLESKQQSKVSQLLKQIDDLSKDLDDAKGDSEKKIAKLNEDLKVKDSALTSFKNLKRDNDKVLKTLQEQLDKNNNHKKIIKEKDDEIEKLKGAIEELEKRSESEASSSKRKRDDFEDREIDVEESPKKLTVVEDLSLEQISDDEVNDLLDDNDNDTDATTDVTIEDEIEDTPVEEAAPSTGSNLINNIDLFTASLSSAREEVESSSIFSNANIEQTTTNDNIEHDKDTSEEVTDKPSENKQKPPKQGKFNSIEDKLKDLFGEDDDANESVNEEAPQTTITVDVPQTTILDTSNERLLNDSRSTIIPNELSLNISYSPAKTSKVAKSSSSSTVSPPLAAPKPSIRVKTIEELGKLSNKNNSFGYEPIDFMDNDAVKQEKIQIDRNFEKLKLDVCDVVKKCLQKFYTNNSITSSLEFESLARTFSHEFREEIRENYLATNGSLLGIEIATDDKRRIIDHIIFFFHIQELVKQVLLKIPVKAHEIKELMTRYTTEFYNKIRQSSKLNFPLVSGMELDPDFKLQISNHIRHNYHGKSEVISL